MGDKAAKQVEAEMGFYKHDSLEKVIRSIGNKLVNALNKKPEEFKFVFHLMDTEEPNAFALPGGHVYVTRGILPIVQTEDELAGIIGHEIIHVVNRHSVRQFHREIFPAVLKIPGNLINAITFSHLGNIINVPIDFLTKPFIAKYSRKHESEADEEGIQLAMRAGYKPGALADVLARLSKSIEAITGEAEKRSYLADHPYTPKRVEDIEKQLKKINTAPNLSPLYAKQENFMNQFNGLCFGGNPKNGAFSDTLFVHPELDFSMIMPSGWTTVNQSDVVAASHKDGDAAVALALSAEKKTHKELGMEMQKKLNKSKNIVVDFAGDTTLHSFPAYLIRLTSVKKGKTFCMEMLWLTYNQNVYQLTGLSVPEKRKATAQALRSFKKATDEQEKQIKIAELQIVLAQNNELIGDLTKRTNNTLKNDLVLIFNDLAPQSALTQNKPVKIVRELLYKK